MVTARFAEHQSTIWAIVNQFKGDALRIHRSFSCEMYHPQNCGGVMGLGYDIRDNYRIISG